MGYTGKPLLHLEYIVDTDVSYYEMGELANSFQEHLLKEYINNYGHEKLCTHLAFLQFQAWEMVRKINNEKEKLNCAQNNEI